MNIDTQLILRLEELARLELTEEERAQLSVDLSKILNMVEKLNELDTQGVDPLIYINEAVNVLRTDKIKHQISKEAAFKNAPDSDGTYFRVPKVIK